MCSCRAGAKSIPMDGYDSLRCFTLYISVPALRQEGRYTHFGQQLYMEFNIAQHDFQRVPFEYASDRYVFRPYRIVPFEECRHTYNLSYGSQPEALQAVSRYTH